jgi:hypothetical protein
MMLKQFAAHVWNRVKARFSKSEIIVYSALTGLVIVALAVGSVTNAVNTSRYTDLVTRAQTSLEEGKTKEAQELVDQAKEVEISDQSMADWLQVRIKEASDDDRYFNIGTNQLSKSNFLEAFKAFSEISKESRHFSAGEEKMSQIRPQAIQEGLDSAKQKADKGDLATAISTLSALERFFGADPRIEKPLSSYQKIDAAKKAQARSRALSGMSKTTDEFSGTVFYQDRSSPRYRNTNGFYIYFGASGDTTQGLRLVVSYYDDSWLFINNARVNVDGKIYTIYSSKWERDNNSSIWEWSDEILSDRDMIEAIIKSRNASIRFDGSQYYDTRTISAGQKAALKNVLKAYDNF